MKNFFSLGITLVLLFGSCTKNENLMNTDNLEAITLQTSNSSINYYVINEAVSTPVCDMYNESAQNRDIEVLFSQPLTYDVNFSFSLQTFDINTSTGAKYNFRYIQSVHPFTYVRGQAGIRKLILQASCVWEDLIECGQYTEIKTKNFRVKLESAEYFNSNENFEYAPATGASNYYDVRDAKKYCQGGGWNPGGPGVN